ncbi:hypothetical protein ACQKMN_08805 [Ureibacillus composti]
MSGYGYDDDVFGIKDSLSRGQIAGIVMKTYGINPINQKNYKEHRETVSAILQNNDVLNYIKHIIISVWKRFTTVRI